MAADKKLIIGNWKMNLNTGEASLYLHKLSKLVKVHRDIEVVLAPSVLSVQTLSLQVNLRQFKLAAQNFYWRDSGTYTGEVSASQLRGIVQYALVGHSERRHIFGESDKDIRNKVAAAIRNGIRPVLCIGETAWEHASGETRDAIHDQPSTIHFNPSRHRSRPIVAHPAWHRSYPCGIPAFRGRLIPRSYHGELSPQARRTVSQGRQTVMTSSIYHFGFGNGSVHRELVGHRAGGAGNPQHHG